MIREELRQLPTTPRDLRKFGLVVGGVFLLLGLWFLLRHKPVWPYLLSPGVLLTVFGLLAPRALRPVYLGWMAMAFALGLVVSTVLLTLFFFLVITPVSLMARLFGKDFLSLRLNPASTSYWLPRERRAPRQVADYERQF
jgi:hypothetical protein